MNRSQCRSARLPIAFLFLAACGPRNGDLLSENKAFDDELMVRMARLVKAIDAMPLEPNATCSAPGKLVYAPQSDAGETDYLMYDALARLGQRGKEEPDKTKIDFHFDGVLPAFLSWIDASSPYYLGQSGRASERATPLVRESFKRAKNIRHLIIVKSQIIDRENGELRLDTYLADLKELKSICGFSVTAHADPKLTVEQYKVVRRNLRTGDETVVRRDSSDNFRSALWNDAREQVFAGVKKQLAVEIPD